MARTKDTIRSERVRLDGNRKRGLNERDDLVFAWLDSNAADKFGAAWELIAAALSGELGPRVQMAVAQGDTAEALDALADLMSAFDN